MSKSDKKAERKAAEKAAAKKAAKKAAAKVAAKAERKAAEKAARKAAEKAAAKKAAKAKGKTNKPAVTIEVQTPDEVAERAIPLTEETRQAALDADTKAGKARRKAEREAEAALPADEIDARIKARLADKTSAPGSKARLDALQKKVATERAARVGETIHDEEGAPYIVDGDGSPVAVEAEPTPNEPAPVEAEPTPDEPAPVEFAKPSESPRDDFEVNGNKQYIVKRPSDGKEVGYTRVTTYISCLEDTTRLTEWKMRVLLEGVAAAEEGGNDAVTARIRDLAHKRDVALTKARKQDRKGKLAPGQLATIVEGTWSDFKRAMDALADELFEVGGGREKAQKGTDLHALCDLYEHEGIAAVNDLLEKGEITPSDFADVEAYVRAMKALGAKVTAVEQPVVNHELKVAGRLDRVVLVKLPEIRNAKGVVVYPGDARARRYVLDLKTGRVDYSMGKIAQQIRLYAEGEAYDLETHESSSHGANRTHGLLLHIPAGSATARLHIVDLTLGAEGNKLAGSVRRWRNEGKKAIDLTADLLTPTEAE